MTSCNSSCPVHCGATLPLQSPFPELLSSNIAPSTDAHSAIIYEAIQKARMDAARVETAFVQLSARRSELNDFIRKNSSILSPIRRFPAEILSQIFGRCVRPNDTFNPRRHAAWVVARVCRRWRAVALDTPELWCHFVVPDSRFPQLPQRNLETLLKMQLNRSRHAQLSIELAAGPTMLDVMDILAASARWGAVTLLNEAQFHRFAKHHSAHYPQLQRLCFSEPDTMQRSRTPSLPLDADMVNSLPALTELLWDAPIFRKQLMLPWAQLSLCELRRVQIADFQWIVSFLPPTAHVTAIKIGRWFHPSLIAKESQIQSLRLEHSSIVLIALIAPMLKKLDLDEHLTNEDVSFITSFMNPSKSTPPSLLEHLRIRSGDISAFWIKMLDSTCARDVVRLDISCRDPRGFLEALGSGDLVPSLRTLAIRVHGTGNTDIELVRRMLAARKPTVRTESFKRWEWDFPERNDLEGGLDVVFLE
ncbi:hypothetical protein FB45DRAFT_1148 [Roridomyces roridus]|uniref:F-box domain-containing protein n=1 Tax=Roridomyces roridus TaxID=1738132 RepID=A0AAD7CHV1_9AGAR|nr:hypothetical protein FB45DRAFT_1148 [Roridomyces roridus]